MGRAWRACRAVPSTIGGHARPRRRWDELSYARRTLPYVSEIASKRMPPAYRPAPSHFADEQFVDAAAVEFHDLEPPALFLEMLALTRQMAKSG